MALCEQLQAAGASLIAIHARYRASWERKGAGARDGPALLEQVTAIRQHLHIPVVTNGNTITYEDVVQNLASTKAHGLMSAEGILDNPALFLPQLGEPDQSVKVPLLISGDVMEPSCATGEDDTVMHAKKKRKLAKKMREIGRLEEKVKKEQPMTNEEKQKLSTKSSVENELASLDEKESEVEPSKPTTPSNPISTPKEISLRDLYDRASDKLNLAQEYLALAKLYPVKIRSVVFHTRRMLKDLLIQYQLLDTCLAADTIADVQQVLHKMEGYQKDPASFVFDIQKESAEKEALERKRYEEGKRKAFEARMIRKAKREGREDLQYYLHRGTETPSKILITELQKVPREKALSAWKEKHSQHCLAFHLDPKRCTRGKACSFLHVDELTANSFNEQDEVAG
jgi:tRNA-dihydrouridine synthase